MSRKEEETIKLGFSDQFQEVETELDTKRSL